MKNNNKVTRERRTIKKTKSKITSRDKVKKKKSFRYIKEELLQLPATMDPILVDKNIHWIERVYWLISYLVLFVAIILFLSPLFERLKKTPTVISVEMDYMNWNVSYPAITLCPFTKPQDEESLKLITEHYINVTGSNLSLYLNTISRINLYNMEWWLNHINETELNLIHPKDYATIAASTFKKFPILSLTTNNNWPISVTAAISEMGMCHVINSNVADFDNPLNWHKDIKINNTRIQITVHEKDFFTQVVGYDEVYKIFLHSPNEILQSAVTIYDHEEPGLLMIGVRVWSNIISEEMKAKPIYVRECRLIDEPLSKRYPIYSYSHCLQECRINIAKSLCGCVPHFFKTIEGEIICDINQLICVLKYRTAIIDMSFSNSLMKKLNRTNLPQSKKDCNCMIDCENFIYLKEYDHFAPDSSTYSLRVGLSSFPRTRVVKEILFSIVDVLLRIAGMINLCTGASVITLADFVLNILKILCRCIYRSNTVNNKFEIKST